MGRVPQSRPLPPLWVIQFNKAVNILNMVINNAFSMNFGPDDFYFEICIERFSEMYVHLCLSEYKKTDLIVNDNKIIIYRDFIFIKNRSLRKRDFNFKVMTPECLNLKISNEN